jgi:PAS domain-containing protein
VHRLFAQQVGKATDETGSLDLHKLAELVTAAYDDFDRDRRRTDRSMSLMIEELDGVQRTLEQTVIKRTRQLQEREAQLQAQNLRFDTALSNMSQGLAMYDAASRLVIYNQRFIAMYRLNPDDIKPGMPLRDLIAQRVANGTFFGSPEQYAADLTARIKAGGGTSQFNELDDGRTIAVVRQPMPGGGWVATHEDVTERRRAEMKIAHMARHDALTDLPAAGRALSRSRSVQERQRHPRASKRRRTAADRGGKAARLR